MHTTPSIYPSIFPIIKVFTLHPRESLPRPSNLLLLPSPRCSIPPTAQIIFLLELNVFLTATEECDFDRVSNGCNLYLLAGAQQQQQQQQQQQPGTARNSALPKQERCRSDLPPVRQPSICMWISFFFFFLDTCGFLEMSSILTNTGTLMRISAHTPTHDHAPPRKAPLWSLNHELNEVQPLTNSRPAAGWQWCPCVSRENVRTRRSSHHSLVSVGGLKSRKVKEHDIERL